MGKNKTVCGQHCGFQLPVQMGGRKKEFNDLVKPLMHWFREKNISLELLWVPSQEMLADPLSWWKKDPGDYCLDRKIFENILRHFQKEILPTVDMFASPGNHQLEKFVTRWPHH